MKTLSLLGDALRASRTALLPLGMLGMMASGCYHHTLPPADQDTNPNHASDFVVIVQSGTDIQTVDMVSQSVEEWSTHSQGSFHPRVIVESFDPQEKAPIGQLRLYVDDHVNAHDPSQRGETDYQNVRNRMRPHNGATIWVYSNQTADNLGKTIKHELGHALGMDHYTADNGYPSVMRTTLPEVSDHLSSEDDVWLCYEWQCN